MIRSVTCSVRSRPVSLSSPEARFEAELSMIIVEPSGHTHKTIREYGPNPKTALANAFARASDVIETSIEITCEG